MSNPETQQQIPSLHFDPSAPAMDADPHPTLARIREGAPIHYWPEARAYIVSRFDDLAQFFRDPRLSTDPTAAGQPDPIANLPDVVRLPFESGLFRLDPKEHARVRRAVSPAFTPRAVERLRPKIQRLVDEALAPFEGKDEIDIAAFADFIPLRVIAEMLAIPKEHEATFRRYADANVSFIDPRVDPERLARMVEGITPGAELIRVLVEERRKSLGDDLLSTLIRAEEAGDKLSEAEMLGLILALITGGSETTVHFICFAVKSLLCVPERVAPVRADPTILRSAMEEILRFDSFGKSGTMRYAVEDVEIGGARLPRGSLLIGFLPAAQRDPRAFPEADKYDPRREPADNLNFGSGMHFCLGASLARVEGEIAIQTLLDRYAEMRLLDEPTYTGHPVLRRISSMRVGVTRKASAA
jgi:cytochrome P450 enzyme